MRRRMTIIAAALALACGLFLFLPRPFSGGQADAGSLPPLAGFSVEARPAQSPVLDLNTATAEELAALPGIGPVRAQAIVDHRTAHGPFRRVEELSAVEGVGSALLEQVWELVTVE